MPPQRKKQTAGTKKVAANKAGTNNDGTSAKNNESVESLQTADEDVNWRSCVAKMVLYEALISGAIPVEKDAMSPQEVFEFFRDEPAFLNIKYEDNFEDRLQRLRNKVIMKNGHRERDARALAHDRLICPRRSHTIDQPHWAVFQAKELLEVNIQNNKHLTFKTKKGNVSRELFWKSRPAYQEFELEEFRGHIYQQIKSIKFENYVKSKRKKNFAQEVAN